MKATNRLAKQISNKTVILQATLFLLFILTLGFFIAKHNLALINSEMSNTNTLGELAIDSMVSSAEISLEENNALVEAMYVDGSLGNKGEQTAALASKIKKGALITATEAEAEDSMMAFGTRIVKSSPHVVGAGSYFERFGVFPTIDDYAIYVEDSTGEVTISERSPYSEYSAKGFYKGAVEKGGEIYVSVPYVDTLTGINMITMARTLDNGGAVAGVGFVDISTDSISNVDLSFSDYKTLKFAVVNSAGDIVGCSFDKSIKNLSEIITDKEILDRIASGSIENDKKIFDVKIQGEASKAIIKSVAVHNETWSMISVISTGEYYKGLVQLCVIQLLLSILFMAMSYLFINSLIRKKLDAISELRRMSESFAEGQFDHSIDLIGEDNELRDLQVSFQNMCSYMHDVIEDISMVLGEISNNNVDISFNQEYKGSLVSIRNSIEQAAGNINDLISRMKTVSMGIGSLSMQVSSAGNNVANSAISQSQSVQTLNDSIRQLNEHIVDSKGNLEDTKKSIDDVQNEIDISNGHMTELRKSMSNVSNASDSIKKVIKTIDDIAFQTNILALNASVEAARAGTAGKGFAVVADEVRNLAHKSAEAVADTTKLLEEVINAIAEASDITETTAESLRRVLEDTGIIVEKTDILLPVADMQYELSQTISGGSEQIAGISQANSGVSEEIASVSHELNDNIQMLNSIINTVNTKGN